MKGQGTSSTSTPRIRPYNSWTDRDFPRKALNAIIDLREDETMLVDFITACVFKKYFGFNIPVIDYYDSKGKHDFGDSPIDYNSMPDVYSAPTVRYAVQWVKDKFGMSIDVEEESCNYKITARGPKGTIKYNLPSYYGIGKAYLCGIRYGMEETI